MNFGFRFNVDHVTISPSTGSTATTARQRDYSLTCSSTLFDPIPLPDNVPSPNFQWLFEGQPSLPSGVTATPIIMSSNSTSKTYASILWFSPLRQSLHAGTYTCRLGPGRLVNSARIRVNGIKIVAVYIIDLWFEFIFLPAPPISIQIITSGAPVVGQSYSLTCGVTGAENLNSSITYQWTKNNGTQTQVPNGDCGKFTQDVWLHAFVIHTP